MANNKQLREENRHLRELRNALMVDNRRLEFERNNAELRADILDHGMTTTLQQRDEARNWARRMKRERDEARREFTLIMADLIQHEYAEFKGVRFTVIDTRGEND